MSNRQIYELNSRVLSTNDILPTQDAAGTSEAGKNTVQDVINLITTVPTASFVATSSYALTVENVILAQTASYVQTAQTASYVQLVAGPGIDINNLAITASVRSINGIYPTNGNVNVSLAGVLSGLSSSNYGPNLIQSSSGAVTASLSNGALWVVAGETGSQTSGSNGQVYIFQSGSVGQWLRVASLDTVAADARYLMLSPQSALAGPLDAGNNNITNVNTIYATSFDGTASWANNAVTASYSLVNMSSSFAATASYALNAASIDTAKYLSTGSTDLVQQLTGSLAATGSIVISGSITSTGSVVANTLAGRVWTDSQVATSYLYPAAYGVGDNRFTWSGRFSPSGSKIPGFPNIFTDPVGTGLADDFRYEYYMQNFNIGVQSYFGTTSTLYVPALSIFANPSTGHTLEYQQGTLTNRFYTLISDNRSVTYTQRNTIATANNRDHVLTVKGNLYSIDGASLGSLITNTHFITGSVNMTGSFMLNGVAITAGGPTVDTAKFISTGSITLTQGITGSLRISGSADVEGTLFGDYIVGQSGLRSIKETFTIDPNQASYANAPYHADYFIPGVDYWQYAGPRITSYANGTGGASAGGYSTQFNFAHSGFGHFSALYDPNGGYFSNIYAESLFLHTEDRGGTVGNTLPGLRRLTTRVVISDGNSLDITNFNYAPVSNAFTANGRTHIFTVSGSMLARDGVSIGTRISNQHIISGSINSTGSITHEGTLSVGLNNVVNTRGGAAIGTGHQVFAALPGLATGRDNTVQGNYSHAGGRGTTTNGPYSHAEGLQSQTYGDYSHAEGYNTATAGVYSHTEGENTTTYGQSSHAEGQNSITFANYSHAEGLNSSTYGLYSHAEGSSTVAFGIASHAEGLGTVASGSYQSVIGRYNMLNEDRSLFIIGNGTGQGNRRDLLRATGSQVQISGSLMMSGSIIPAVSDTDLTSSFSLGSPTAAWKDLYISNGTIFMIGGDGTVQGQLSSNADGMAFDGDIKVSNSGSLGGRIPITVGRGAGLPANNVLNTAVGVSALAANTSGSLNTAIGGGVLDVNTTGGSNTGVGASALASNVTGTGNTAVGTAALSFEVNGNNHTAVGLRAGYFMSGATANTYVGADAGYGSTTANGNVGVGFQSLYLKNGGLNTALGYQAGYNATASAANVYIGYQAGPSAATVENYKLYINFGSGTPLIGGDFQTRTVEVNGTSGIQLNGGTGGVDINTNSGGLRVSASLGGTIISGSVTITGSTTLRDVLVLQPRTTTPIAPVTGSIIMSGSGASLYMYVYTGAGTHSGWARVTMS